MAMYVKIEAGVVTNRVDADVQFASDQGLVGPVDSSVDIGHLYDAETGEFTRPAALLSQAAAVATVNAERDARIDGGFMYAGARYQSRPSDRENVANAKDFAEKAQALGAEPDDLFWHLLTPEMGYPADQPFAWIPASNTPVPMDAWGPPALYAAGATFKTQTTLYAFGLKAALAPLTDEQRPAALAAASGGWPT